SDSAQSRRWLSGRGFDALSSRELGLIQTAGGFGTEGVRTSPAAFERSRRADVGCVAASPRRDARTGQADELVVRENGAAPAPPRQNNPRGTRVARTALLG